MTSLIRKIKAAIELHNLRNVWARENGYKSYGHYQRTSEDADAYLDSHNGFNVWLAVRNGGRIE